MASVCGVSIRNRRLFKDHEGMNCYQGEIYLSGKKIGFWSEDFKGSPWSDLKMEPGYSEEKLRQAVQQARAPQNSEKSIETSICFELLMMELNKLENMEILYNEAKKLGYIGVLVSTDGFHIDYWRVPAGYQGRNILEEYKEELEQSHSQFLKNSKVEDKYYSEDDFIVGNAISEREIRI